MKTWPASWWAVASILVIVVHGGRAGKVPDLAVLGGSRRLAAMVDYHFSKLPTVQPATSHDDKEPGRCEQRHACYCCLPVPCWLRR